MEKFIPFEKLSKKEQQKRNAARRGSWYGLNPVTRKPENSKAYNRRKAQKWSDDSGSVPFVISVRSSSATVFFDYSPADFEHLIKPWRFLRMSRVAPRPSGEKTRNREYCAPKHLDDSSRR
ncbi:MAG: hypothetical protein GXW99_01515 [Clostridiales bacterium]|nr:hypothetical protein [Clostridiales bacterium]